MTDTRGCCSFEFPEGVISRDGSFFTLLAHIISAGLIEEIFGFWYLPICLPIWMVAFFGLLVYYEDKLFLSWKDVKFYLFQGLCFATISMISSSFFEDIGARLCDLLICFLIQSGLLIYYNRYAGLE